MNSPTREELLALIEDAWVPEAEWNDRDSAGAHRQLGECYALLKAGCDFDLSPVEGPHEDTYWIRVRSKGFRYHESFEPGDDPADYLDEENYYVPTRSRLDRSKGGDWY